MRVPFALAALVLTLAVVGCSPETEGGDMPEQCSDEISVSNVSTRACIRVEDGTVEVSHDTSFLYTEHDVTVMLGVRGAEALQTPTPLRVVTHSSPSVEWVSVSLPEGEWVADVTIVKDGKQQASVASPSVIVD